MKVKNTFKNIEFKSSPEYYKKEESGLKPNTVRKIEIQDKRFQILIYQMLNKEYGNITIRSTHNRNFTRKIKDVTVWGDLMIISWEDL